jgi:pyrimidine-specific ribonucleoside hydrolase
VYNKEIVTPFYRDLEMKRRIFLLILILLSFSSLFALSGKVKNHILIDTDTAADDLRAICLLLASDEFEVIAITTSDGVLDPENGLKKVRALLKSFGHKGIPTASGEISQSNPPPWRRFNQNLNWGDESHIETKSKKRASDLIISSIEKEEKPVTLTCLGSLTNLAEAFRVKPEIRKRIRRIVWYNDNIYPYSGTNYEFDKKAADYIFSENITVNVVNNLNGKEIVFTEKLLRSIENIKTPYAQKIAKSHLQNDIFQLIKIHHLKLWDDLVALYLLHPELFETRIIEGHPNHSISRVLNTDKIEKEIIEILSCDIEDISVTFKQFPDESHLFREDISQFMNQIIERHGRKEWKIVVVTNEFHDHLGIYSIIGAKMGLRAREYFHVGLDELSVVSYAGSKPPISCFNDGLQVSTGATLGHGTISVSADSHQIPKATFTFKNKTISLKLKEDYWDIVKKDIKQAIKQHGLLTDNYWRFIRERAISYWLEWSRKEIFNIKVIK